MITKQTSPTFTTDDGTKWDTIERAQEHELTVLFQGVNLEQAIAKHETGSTMAAAIMLNSDKVLAILNATGRKQRVRKAAKKAKTAPTP